MKEALIAKGPKVTLQDAPIPEPGPHQVLIKVVCSGCNPKDWQMAEIFPDRQPTNEGDDIAGIVEAVGESVYEFKKGDRVAAFHEIMAPHGSYAEYAIGWDHTTFHLPEKTTFEEGAALPLTTLTSALALFVELGLPSPWMRATKPIPLVIYGGSSAIGSYAIQFAQRANIHPVICVAGRAQAHVESLINRSKGDVIVDYRAGNEAVVQSIREALKGAKLEYAFDCVSEKPSYVNLGQVMDPETGRITLIRPGQEFPEIPAGIARSNTFVGVLHGEDDHLKDFGYVYSRYISKALQDGWLKAQPQQIMPDGLVDLETALKDLKDGKASGVKYIFKIADTPGVKA